MSELRIGNPDPSGIERFQALREEAMRRSRMTAAHAAAGGKTPVSDAVHPRIPAGNPSAVSRANPATPDARSPLGRLIDVRA